MFTELESSQPPQHIEPLIQKSEEQFQAEAQPQEQLHPSKANTILQRPEPSAKPSPIGVAMTGIVMLYLGGLAMEAGVSKGVMVFGVAVAVCLYLYQKTNARRRQ